MSKKRRKNTEKGPSSETPSDDWLGLLNAPAVTYLANQYLERIEGDGIEPWKTVFRLRSFSDQDKRDAAVLERNLIEASQRGAGRPRREDAGPRDVSATIAVVEAVRDFIVCNPGAMVRVNERLRYNEDFKRFVLELVSKDGLAHGMTLEEAANAIGMPYHTLSEWTSGKGGIGGK